MPQPESTAVLIARDRTFSHDADGRPITRESVCECGKPFTQILLSEWFLEWAEREHAISAVRTQIPGLFVPVHCPHCERIDLRRQQQIEIARRTPTREYDHAAD